MSNVLILKLYGRSFIVREEDTYKNFIVKDLHDRDLEVGDELVVDNCLKFYEGGSENVRVNLELIKKVSNKVLTYKYKRRKRYSKLVGYKQHIVYFKVKKVISK